MPMFLARVTTVVLFALTVSNAFAADSPKRVLLVTHAGGFMHDSLLTAEKTLKSIGAEHGLQVTCWRFTADPDARINFQQHLLGGLKWALGQADGDATPSNKLKPAVK